ncbi:MAG TPA: DUF1634 domain-containing protein [Phycisphaerae bacterium]|nr:DUF1634 domain-containing protein [Phycisphaerae bacterium]
MSNLNDIAAEKTKPNSIEPEVRKELTIQNVAAWVLRTGVAISALLMFAGLVVSFMHHPASVQRMQSIFFDYHPSVIWGCILAGQGRGFIDLGILVLALTPIIRVAASMVLFAVIDRDWFYTLVTLAVLVMTLISLLLLS